MGVGAGDQLTVTGLITMLSTDKLRFIFGRIRERLWVRPLVLCVLSIGGTFVAKLADDAGLSGMLPDVTLKSVESLLSIMASSMLVIATFAVGSMVAAYVSASTSATPRSIPLVIADDVTQNALSAFIGAFIFSIVSLIAIQNELFESAGRFAIFVLTLLVFAIVIITFVRWVDRIARLGRVVNTIEQVEIQAITYDRVSVPELMVDDLFDDTRMVAAAKKHSRRALAHSETALTLSDDIDAVRTEAAFSAF